MITLELANYCGDCGMFEAEEHRLISEDFDCSRHVYTTVHCKHEGRCRRIYNYLKGELKHDLDKSK